MAISKLILCDQTVASLDAFDDSRFIYQRGLYFMKSGLIEAAFVFGAIIFASIILNDESLAQSPVREPIRLPGLVVDFSKQSVDLEATVCLDDGFLELVACAKGSKEHESIVSVVGRPMHIHTALLLLNVDNGNPAMRKLVSGEDQRWVDIPPKGDRVEVFFVIKDSNGKTIERPVRDFVTREEKRLDGLGLPTSLSLPTNGKAFPEYFVFSGSILRDNGPGPRTYLADVSGHVLSIASFGDETLCLPNPESKRNATLTWRVNPKHLPKVGTKITLRLRPTKKHKAGVKK